MKRFLAFMAACFVADLLLPSPPDIGAQTMIAPAVLAAIIGAVGTVLGSAISGKPKEGGQTQQGQFMPPQRPSGAGAPRLPESMTPGSDVWYRSGGSEAIENQHWLDQINKAFETPNYNKKVQKVDEGPAAATMDFRIGRDDQVNFTPLTGSPPQVNRGEKDTFQLFPTGPQTSRNEGPGGTFGLGTDSISLSGSDKKGLDMDKTLQMAAMAASLGSLLNAGGPPRPPSLPGGGSFSAQPTSMRFLYGG